MLRLDLRQLRQKRLTLDDTLAPDDEFWTGFEVRPAGPFHVRMDAQMAGEDVIVRGDISGKLSASCRRCLQDVTVSIAEEVALVFRPGLTRVEAEEAEVYALPEKGDELDLKEAIREQVVLAVPRFVICEEACRGLCPQCGTNLNETQCDCQTSNEDPRWAALRAVRERAELQSE